MEDVLGLPKPMVPVYLYHYTTVESLAMILKTKKIRLSSLDNMDDMRECRNSGVSSFARFVFVSSWTEDSEESIPMWNMYAKMERGVRIKLSSMPIAEFELDHDTLERNGLFESWTAKGALKQIVPGNEFFINGYMPLPFTKKHILQKVYYTNDKSFLEQKTVTKGSFSECDIDSLGIYKSTSWAFQREWRYRVVIYPISFSEYMEADDDDLDNVLLSRMANGQIPLPIRYFDVTIDDTAFAQMEVTLNPKISDGNRIIVELLKREYNPTMIVSESVLANTIR